MKVKQNSILVIAILSVSLLSLGVVDSFADSVYPLHRLNLFDIYDPLAMTPMLSLGVDVIVPSIESAYAQSTESTLVNVGMDVNIPQSSYADGERVELSGQISSYNASRDPHTPVVIQIYSPTNALIQIHQISASNTTPFSSLTSEGRYMYTFPVGGKQWKDSGNYTVKVFFGADAKAQETITFVAPDPEPVKPDPVPDPEPVKPDPVPDPEPDPTPIPPPPPPPPPPCPDGTIREGDDCVPVIPPEPEPTPQPICGPGTELIDGICMPSEPEPEPSGGGCLIATAAHGTELAPQVQFLREIRDNTVMSTSSGTAFMTTFNQVYYSFSPTIADMERSNPAFQQTVRAFITPMIASLSIMTLAEDGSEMDVLGLGISVIALNIGMYLVAPALVGITIHRRLRSKRS